MSLQVLREVALRHPGAEEGVACEGTPLERRTVKARKKAFLFLGLGDAMVKLRDSLPEATRLAEEDPAHFKVGAHGWVTARFAPDEVAPIELLCRWVDESHQLVAASKRKG